MMYCSYPEISAEDRLQHLPAIDSSQINLSPTDAAAKAQIASPDEVTLSSLLGRPVDRFRTGRKIIVVHADSGGVFRGFDEDEARQSAAAWERLPPSTARLETIQIHEDDQWTVRQHYRAYRPLWKFVWPNGDATYVSDVTGEVVQYTTQKSRLGAYFGAIPHWIYFTRLRRQAAAWRLAVLWLSGAGVAMTLLGLIAGVWLYSPSKRYRFKTGRSSVPFGGQQRGHVVLGLFLGL